MQAIIVSLKKEETKKSKQQSSLIMLEYQKIHIYLKDNQMKANQERKNKSTEPAFKIVLIGDAATGKSSLMRRFVKDEFSDSYQNTIGTEFVTKKVSIDDNTEMKMQIWDTAGQQTFRSIIKAFFRNSSAILLVYNITDARTLAALEDWKKLAQESVPLRALFVLIGTHLDREQKREVSRSQAQKWMNDQAVDFFFQTSAKTSENVQKVFQEVGKRIFSNWLGQKKALQTESQAETVVKMKLQNMKKEEVESNCC